MNFAIFVCINILGLFLIVYKQLTRSVPTHDAFDASGTQAPPTSTVAGSSL